MDNDTMEIKVMEIEMMDQGELEGEVHGVIYDMNARGEKPSLDEVVRIIVGSRMGITGGTLPGTVRAPPRMSSPPFAVCSTLTRHRVRPWLKRGPWRSATRTTPRRWNAS